jgi:Flp pilus assembly protein CpaB
MTTELDKATETLYAGPPPARRSLLSRIKLGHVVMITAAILALIFNLAVLRSRDATVDVMVASGDIPAGSTLNLSHFATATVPADDLLTSRFIAATDLESVVGRLATRAIADGDPILESDLLVVQNRDGLRAMSIPIDQSRAVGGRLVAGDSVDVVLVQDGVATYIATGVEVLDVPSSDTNALGARTGYAPTLAVDATQALRIAAALDVGDVHMIRSTGSAIPDLDQATAIEQPNDSAEGGPG